MSGLGDFVTELPDKFRSFMDTVTHAFGRAAEPPPYPVLKPEKTYEEHCDIAGTGFYKCEASTDGQKPVPVSFNNRR
jgi:hypothetical protein